MIVRMKLSCLATHLNAQALAALRLHSSISENIEATLTGTARIETGDIFSKGKMNYGRKTYQGSHNYYLENKRLN